MKRNEKRMNVKNHLRIICDSDFFSLLSNVYIIFKNQFGSYSIIFFLTFWFPFVRWLFPLDPFGSVNIFLCVGWSERSFRSWGPFVPLTPEDYGCSRFWRKFLRKSISTDLNSHFFFFFKNSISRTLVYLPLGLGNFILVLYAVIYILFDAAETEMTILKDMNFVKRAKLLLMKGDFLYVRKMTF